MFVFVWPIYWSTGNGSPLSTLFKIVIKPVLPILQEIRDWELWIRGYLPSAPCTCWPAMAEPKLPSEPKSKGHEPDLVRDMDPGRELRPLCPWYRCNESNSRLAQPVGRSFHSKFSHFQGTCSSSRSIPSWIPVPRPRTKSGNDEKWVIRWDNDLNE